MELNYIKCGNSAELLKELPDNSIDLVVTSPPYDNMRKYNGFTFDFETIAKELYRVTKEGGVVVWVVGDETVDGSETGTSFRQALFFKNIGFNLHDTMIYEKKQACFGSNLCYLQSFEYMFVFSKNRPKTTNLIYDRPNKLQGLASVATGSKKKNEKGVIPRRTIEIVLDPFAGSGTTLDAAIQNKRQYIGFEISEEYCKIAEKRIEGAKKIANQVTFEDLFSDNQTTFDDVLKGGNENG